MKTLFKWSVEHYTVPDKKNRTKPFYSKFKKNYLFYFRIHTLLYMYLSLCDSLFRQCWSMLQHEAWCSSSTVINCLIVKTKRKNENSWSQMYVRCSHSCKLFAGDSDMLTEGYPKVREDFTITEKAPTWAFSWLKVPTSAFTFKTLLAWCFIAPRPFWLLHQRPNFTSTYCSFR